MPISHTITRHAPALTVIGLLIYGWLHRDSNYLSAETGMGYILGITGASLMLVLLLYPVSKRISLFTRWLPLRYWFGLHMMLGIVGPLMILFHSNFHLGSINSNIALFCMLIVAISGLAGRYFYTHIHHGLYGNRITLQELKQNIRDEHDDVFNEKHLSESITARLAAIEDKALEPYTGIIACLQHAAYLGAQGRKIQKQLTHHLRDNPDYDTIRESVGLYILALRRIAAFKLYERLFSLWHILHLPLFFMMIITAIIHVFAVHMY